jgi:exodeoxyribonuclease V gamma subunit
VLVSQLRDTLKARFAPETPAVLQPLQAFSAQYFKPNSVFYTYADDWEKAQQLDSKKPSSTHVPLLTGASFPAITEWSLRECMRLLKQPVEVYWRSRLGVQLNGPEEALQDDENFALNGLDRYILGRALLEAGDIDQQLEAEALMGQLPMGAAGQGLLKQQYDAALRVKDRASIYLERYAVQLPIQSVELSVAMPWGDVRISAEIPDLRQGELGYLQMSTRPGAVATGQKDQQTARADVLINLWPNHVFLCAAGWNVRSVAVGLDGVAVLPPLSADSAKQLLVKWLTAYTQAWMSPLPITFKAGLAFLTAYAKLSLSEKEAAVDQSTEQATEQALDKASKAFIDNYADDTDFARSLYVQRSFDSFENLRSGLPVWAPILYADLISTAAMEGGAA